MPRRPPDPRVTSQQDAYGRLYASIGQESETWYWVSHRLRRAARVLSKVVVDDYRQLIAAPTDRPRPYVAPVDGPLALLLGLAFENLVKALLVKRDPGRVSPDRLKAWAGGGHDLVELFRAAKVPLDIEDEHLLEGLTAAVVWSGRYPVPNNAEALLPRTSPDGEFHSLGGFQLAADGDRADALWVRVEAILTAERTH